jgi:uncharacterized membrane protein (UPF0182 family)
VNALINQDTTISQQFTLWDQVGSQVARGNMVIFPIGKMLIYIQPVYLKSSTSLKIPELKRLIMTQGQVVVMEKSLEEAYAKMMERLKEETVRLDRRFAPMEAEPAPAAIQPNALPPSSASSLPAARPAGSPEPDLPPIPSVPPAPPMKHP